MPTVFKTVEFTNVYWAKKYEVVKAEIHLDKAETNVIFSDMFVGFAEESWRWNSQKVSLFGQPFDKPIVSKLICLRTQVNFWTWNKQDRIKTCFKITG